MDLQQNQSCWKLELEDLDNDSSGVSKFDPCKNKKKKKKKKQRLVRGGDDILFQKGRYFAEDDNAPHCHKFEPDYGYEELLSRVFGMLGEEVATERPRTVMMPPQLLAQGTQGTTVCLNFGDLCRTMHRKPDHVTSFVLGQMETKGLLNKQQRLEMNGLVSCEDFQAVFRRYIDAFVICSCCKSPDTDLVEDNGLLTLRLWFSSIDQRTESPVNEDMGTSLQESRWQRFPCKIYSGFF